jgi:hypothetical protein
MCCASSKTAPSAPCAAHLPRPVMRACISIPLRADEPVGPTRRLAWLKLMLGRRRLAEEVVLPFAVGRSAAAAAKATATYCESRTHEEGPRPKPRHECKHNATHSQGLVARDLCDHPSGLYQTGRRHYLLACRHAAPQHRSDVKQGTACCMCHGVGGHVPGSTALREARSTECRPCIRTAIGAAASETDDICARSCAWSCLPM